MQLLLSFTELFRLQEHTKFLMSGFWENAMVQEVLHALWDIRRKDFIKDKLSERGLLSYEMYPDCSMIQRH